jgi:hypothetical protein
MRFRPRYSLLTLLLFTALVAGGVKLWHGPHHVVESDGPNLEKEYSYTLDWRGNRVINGPTVIRRFEDQKLMFFNVGYTRHGDDVDWMFMVGENKYVTYGSPPEMECPLSAEELRTFHQVRDVELQRFVATGMSTKGQYEGGMRSFFISGAR